MVSRKRRRVVQTARFEQELEAVLKEHPRAEESFRGFEEVVSRQPTIGMSVRDQPTNVCGLPIHTEGASFLVLYRYDERRVVCLALRRVPSGQF